MRLTRSELIGLYIAVGLCGCGSPSNVYYTLNPVEPTQATAGTSAGATVAIDEVSVPAALDRPQIVMKQDATRVDVREYDRWISPLDGMIRMTLAGDLRARLGPSRLLDTPDGADYALSLAIDAFGQDGESVVLQGHWSLKTQHGDTPPAPSQHMFRETTPVESKDLPASVSAMSRLLATVSDGIAASIEPQAGNK